MRLHHPQGLVDECALLPVWIILCCTLLFCFLSIFRYHACSATWGTVLPHAELCAAAYSGSQSRRHIRKRLETFLTDVSC